MVNIIALCGFAILTALISLILKNINSEYSVYVGLIGGCFILISLLTSVDQIQIFINNIIGIAGISNENFSLLIKAIGIGYISQFSSDVCKDAGVNNLSSKIEFAGKISILLLCIPVANNLLEIIKDFLGT